ncbi:MAG: hypothetical protein AAB833_02210 [Patescibacteria group bacterium]
MGSYRRKHNNRYSSTGGGLFFKLLAMSIVMGSGVGVFYGAVTWFRQDAARSLVNAGWSGATIVDTEDISPRPVLVETPLVNSFDQAVIGKVKRYAGPRGEEYEVVANLPAIDLNTERFGVWLLMTGLADVQLMGELTPRADGTWQASFVAGPETGVINPADYRAVTIRREERSSQNIQNGVRVATAEFAE